MLGLVESCGGGLFPHGAAGLFEGDKEAHGGLLALDDMTEVADVAAQERSVVRPLSRAQLSLRFLNWFRSVHRWQILAHSLQRLLGGRPEERDVSLTK